MLPFLDAFKRLAATRAKPMQDLIEKDPATGKIIKVKAIILSLSFVDACAVEIEGIDYSQPGVGKDGHIQGPWVFGTVIGPGPQAFTTFRNERIPLTFNRHATTLAVPITDEEFEDLQRRYGQAVEKAREEAYGKT